MFGSVGVSSAQEKPVPPVGHHQSIENAPPGVFTPSEQPATGAGTQACIDNNRQRIHLPKLEPASYLYFQDCFQNKRNCLLPPYSYLLFSNNADTKQELGLLARKYMEK